MPRCWWTRWSKPDFGSRSPKVPSSPLSRAEGSSTRSASKEISFFCEPADQHPCLTVTAASARSRHDFRQALSDLKYVGFYRLRKNLGPAGERYPQRPQGLKPVVFCIVCGPTK